MLQAIFLTIFITAIKNRKMKYVKILTIVLLYLWGCKTTKPLINKVSYGDNVKKDIHPIDSTKILIDTLGYTKSIVDNKEKYINKKFLVLLDDLKIPIKSYSPGMGNDRNVSVDVTFSFDDKVTTTNRQGGDLEQKPIYLTIVWQKPLLNTDMIRAISGSHNNGDWGTIEKEYFSKQIVGDIFYH